MPPTSRRKTRSARVPCPKTTTPVHDGPGRTQIGQQQITTPGMVSERSTNKRAADDLSLGESSDDDSVGNLLKRPCVRNEGNDGEKENVDVKTTITMVLGVVGRLETRMECIEKKLTGGPGSNAPLTVIGKSIKDCPSSLTSTKIGFLREWKEATLTRIRKWCELNAYGAVKMANRKVRMRLASEIYKNKDFNSVTSDDEETREQVAELFGTALKRMRSHTQSIIRKSFLGKNRKVYGSSWIGCDLLTHLFFRLLYR